MLNYLFVFTWPLCGLELSWTLYENTSSKDVNPNFNLSPWNINQKSLLTRIYIISRLLVHNFQWPTIDNTILPHSSCSKNNNFLNSSIIRVESRFSLNQKNSSPNILSLSSHTTYTSSGIFLPISSRRTNGHQVLYARARIKLFRSPRRYLLIIHNVSFTWKSFSRVSQVSHISSHLHTYTCVCEERDKSECHVLYLRNVFSLNRIGEQRVGQKAAGTRASYSHVCRCASEGLSHRGREERKREKCVSGASQKICCSSEPRI